MRPVYINGYSHLSALGDETALAKQLQSGIAERSVVDLEIADIPAINYYPLPQSKYPLLETDSLISRAMQQSTLDNRSLLKSSYYFGTSSMGIAKNEAETAASGEICLKELGRAHQSTIDRLGGVGPVFTFNTACTSSANALLAAQQMIASGAIEHAVVIGTDRLNKTTLAGFSALQLLSDEIKPFDRQRSGIVLGDAISVIILAAEPHPAYRHRLLGGANQGDTSSPTGTDEGGQSIAHVISEALDNSGVSADQIGLIKAQAAGSPGNDLAEANGLKRVFTTLPSITSLKPYIGHTLGASGCSELSLLISCFESGFVPACPGFEQRDEQLDITPLTNHQYQVPQYTLLNFFGFGGNNTALILESSF